MAELHTPIGQWFGGSGGVGQGVPPRGQMGVCLWGLEVLLCVFRHSLPPRRAGPMVPPWALWEMLLCWRGL
eukprot:11198321-Lingulodinium_polyedra.AAC.1